MKRTPQKVNQFGSKKNLDLTERVECLAKNTVFITVKDHKENWQASLPYRLFNPSKS